MSTVERVSGFITERFLFDSADVGLDSSLVRTGVLDSTGVMELVVFLEADFGIKIADAELVPDNFDTVRAIASFVDRKLGSPGGAGAAHG